jgi:hypothetical protein
VGKVGHIKRLRGEAAPALCATNRMPISYELAPSNVTDLSLTEALLAEAKWGEEVARKLLVDLAYRSQELEEELIKLGIMLVTNEAGARRPGYGGRSRLPFRASSGPSVSARPWPPLPWGWSPGSRPR